MRHFGKTKKGTMTIYVKTRNTGNFIDTNNKITHISLHFESAIYQKIFFTSLMQLHFDLSPNI